MNYKLLLIEIFAILVSYLIFTMPVAYADSFSEYLPEEKKQFQESSIEQANPEPIFKSFVDYFTSSLPEMVSGFFSTLSNIVSGFIDTLFPSVRAQSCNYNTTCDSGEDIGSCCYDCGCQNDDYYCDISSPEPPISSSGCELLSDIALAYIGISDTTFTNCNQDHEVNLTVEVVDAPQTMVFESKTFYLNNNQYSGTIWEDCEPGAYQDYYICPITIPILEDCTEGQHVLSQNSLELNITFSDGPGSGEKSLTRGFPDITISSFSCGNGIYEPELGERQNNCCYDAGCPFNQYCDISDGDRGSGNYVAGSCEYLLRDIDLIIKNANPLYFDLHEAGDEVNFLAEIHNKPSSLSVSNPTCSIDDASCILSCTNAGSSNPDIHNMTCTLGFTINDYDELQSYSLKPDINISVNYNNASGAISDVLSKTNAFTISIRETVCGDGHPGSGENYQTCCYDVNNCPINQYCDWPGRDPEDASCELSEFGLNIIDVNPTEFTIKTNGVVQWEVSPGITEPRLLTKDSEVNITFELIDAPPSFSNWDAECGFGTEYIDCYVNSPCERNAITNQITCSISIGQIQIEMIDDYLHGNQIILNTNTFNYSFDYTNASYGSVQTMTAEFTRSIPQITMNVEPTCGNGVCENGTGTVDLGETPGTCCFDCGCYGSQECAGFIGNSECINPGDIVLILDFPGQRCEISKIDGSCIFDSLDFTAQITNPPEDIDIDEIMIIYEDEPLEEDVTCDRIENTNNYQCYVHGFPSIENAVEGNETKNLNITFSIVYTVLGQPTRKLKSEIVTFDVSREWSADLKTCNQLKAEKDEEIAEANRKRGFFSNTKKLYLAITATLWAAWAACQFIFDCAGVGEVFKRLAGYFSLGSCLMGILPDKWFVPTIEEMQDVRDVYNNQCGDTGIRLVGHRELKSDLERASDELHDNVASWNLKDWFRGIASTDFLNTVSCIAGLISIFNWWGAIGNFISGIFKFGEGKAEQGSGNIGGHSPRTV